MNNENFIKVVDCKDKRNFVKGVIVEVQGYDNKECHHNAIFDGRCIIISFGLDGDNTLVFRDDNVITSSCYDTCEVWYNNLKITSYNEACKYFL